MHTSFSVLALAGLLAGPVSSASPDLVWWRDYHVAQQKGVKEKKPLAVFVGTGPGGYHQLAQEGQLSDAVKRVLSDSYVCVYLDAGSNSQKGLIQALEVTKGKGLVLSDRTGSIQAFHHDGQIAAAELGRQLQRFAASTVEIRTTLTNANQRVSYYPNGSSDLRQAVYSPATFARSC